MRNILFAVIAVLFIFTTVDDASARRGGGRSLFGGSNSNVEQPRDYSAARALVRTGSRIGSGALLADDNEYNLPIWILPIVVLFAGWQLIRVVRRTSSAVSRSVGGRIEAEAKAGGGADWSRVEERIAEAAHRATLRPQRIARAAPTSVISRGSVTAGSFGRRR